MSGTHPDRARGPRLFLLAAGVALVALSFTGPGGKLRLVAIGVALAGGGLLVIARGRATSAIAPLFTAALYSGSIFLTFRTGAIELTLLLSSGVFLLAALASFAARGRRMAGMSFALVLVLLTLAGVEWGFSAASGREPGNVTHEGAIVERGEPLSSRTIPGGEQHHASFLPDGSTEFDVIYRIDSGDGSRGLPNRPDTGDMVLLFGGSYTFGHSVAVKDSTPYLAQAALPDLRLYNFAVSGYGAGDVHFYLREKLEERPETRSCAYLMIEDHLRRVACPDSLTRFGWGRYLPRFEVTDGELNYLGSAYESLGLLRRLSVDLQIRSKLFRLLVPGWELDGETLAVGRKLVEGMRNTAGELPDCRFRLVILPSRTAEVMNMLDLDAWIASLDEAGVRVVDLRRPFAAHLKETGRAAESYYYRNNHPRPELNRWIAARLSETIRAAMSAEEPR